MSCSHDCGCGCDRCCEGECCRGLEPVTPRPIWNAPGQASLQSRIGARASFFETMRARLSSSDYEELKDLTARTLDDPSIALLDGCATVADILTFYQERTANEGYLRTATERRSVQELGRLIGYRARPGVSASVHLAYDIDDNATDPVEIAAGSATQSIPGPGERPQTFETIEKLVARKEWNAIRPRPSRPASFETLINGTLEEPGARVWLQGISTRLEPGDAILVEHMGIPEVYQVQVVEPDTAADRTRVSLATWRGDRIPSVYDPDPDLIKITGPGALPGSIARSREIIARLSIPRSVPPINALALRRDADALFAPGADIGLAAIRAASPPLGTAINLALASAGSTEVPSLRVFALRKHSLLFGATAPERLVSVNSDTGVPTTQEWSDHDVIRKEDPQVVFLEAPADKVLSGSWVALDYAAVPWSEKGQLVLPDLSQDSLLISRAANVQPKVARNAYGVSSQTTRVRLQPGAVWFKTKETGPGVLHSVVTVGGFDLVRSLDVLCQSEELELALDPITEPVCGGDQWIETDGFYPGLESGRWIVVNGKRADVPGTDEVDASELAMISGIRHDAERVPVQTEEIAFSDREALLHRTSAAGATLVDDRAFLPGESLRTYIQLAAPLSYCYLRATASINANVAKANHGETRVELLGSGDASQARQVFALRQPPLTFVAANEPEGVASTLRVYVNGVEWHEAPAVGLMEGQSRSFLAEIDNDANSTLTFGDGVHGARLPTGENNVEAHYRMGIGLAGNVRPGQISQLMTRQLGVRGVVNPIAAAGGSDRDPIERMRDNAPLSVASLDRLVSVSDYADFARTFAGIAKAASTRLSFGGRTGVWLTIAGNDDIDIPPDSDLFQMLARAMRDYGDPDLPVKILARDRLTLQLSARIAASPDHKWDDVEARVRASLLDRYSFETMRLGESVPLSAITALIQSQRGVDYVDIDSFGAVSAFDAQGQRLAPEEVAASFAAIVAVGRADGPPGKVQAQGIRVESGVVRPAQIACVAPDLPDSVILNRIEQP